MDLDTVPFLLELLLKFAQPLLTACRRHDARSLTGKKNGGFTADTAGRADNENDLVFKGNWHVNTILPLSESQLRLNLSLRV